MRTTDKGLEPGTYLRVRNAPNRKHAHGTFVRLDKNGRVEYRSDYNGGIYTTTLDCVMIDRKLNKRMQHA